MARAAILLVFVSALCGCSKSSSEPPQTTAPPSTARNSTDASNAAGKIIGKAPAASSSGAVVVVLEPRTALAFPPQGEKPAMDQVGLTFGPELLLVRTGQPVEFRNNDDTLHNVNVKHEETREQAFNVAIPTGGAYRYTFARDGFYRVGCDIHPAMAASVFAASTPYTTLADTDGRFSFADIAPGAYTATLYGGGRKVQQAVDVKGGVVEVTIQ